MIQNSFMPKALLVGKKYAPEFLLGFGISGMIGATVLACKATLKTQEVKAIYLDVSDTIERVRVDLSEDAYSEEDYQKDKRLAKTQYILNVAELYGPAVALGIFSLAAIVGSHHILSQRNIGLIAAYKLLDEGFRKYRERVVGSIDEDADRYFRYGGEKKNYALIKEKGKKKKEDPDLLLQEDEPPWELEGSIYAKYFDESSPQFKRDNTMNLFFLKAQQNYANDLLKMQGHIFLNEVYDMLGIPRTKAGAVVGWLQGYRDDFVDFNLMNPDNGLHRDYVNGYAPYILVDFNVDGIIYDLI